MKKDHPAWWCALMRRHVLVLRRAGYTWAGVQRCTGLSPWMVKVVLGGPAAD